MGVCDRCTEDVGQEKTRTGVHGWMQTVVAELLGCPTACETLPRLSKSWRESAGCAVTEHNFYRCRRSKRRVSLSLPEGVFGPAEGLTPAEYAFAWRRKSSDLDSECMGSVLSSMSLRDGAADASASSAVRCPHRGCSHEASSAADAACHAASCPVGARRAAAWRAGWEFAVECGRRRGAIPPPGFCYAPPSDVMATLKRWSLRERGDLTLDANLGGRPGASPLHCLCEVDERLPGIVFRRQDEIRNCLRFRLGSTTAVHRGWELGGPARRSFETAAFPRAVDLTVFAGCYNNTYDYYTTRLSGWSFVPSQREELLPPDVWERTLAVTFPAAPGAKKQQDASVFLRDASQRKYDQVYVYVLGVIGDSSACSDAAFPANTDEWRVATGQRFQDCEDKTKAARSSEVQRLLAVSYQAVSKEDISSEYSQCATSCFFVTFPSRLIAERFVTVLELAIRDAQPLPSRK